jgi:hypothetical protein
MRDERGLSLEFEGLDQNPDGFIALIVEQGHRHIARVLLERKVEAERAMQFSGNDPVPETSIEFLISVQGATCLKKFFPTTFG